jgi:hypothetical protein
MLKTTVGLLILIVINTSCQKEMSIENNPSAPISPTADSNYIDTLYETQQQLGITDTVGYYKYSYDNLKRVISMNWEWGDFQVSYDDSGRIVYFYNNADTFPYKSLFIVTSDGKHVFDTLLRFYFFNSSGVLIRDSSVIATQTSYIGQPATYTISHLVNNYLYSPGLIVRRGSEIPVLFPPQVPLAPVYYIDSTRLNSSNNQVSNVKYLAYNVPSGYSLIYTIAASYDTKPNPHKKLNIFKMYTPVHPGPAYFPEEFIGQNNMQSCSVLSSSGTNELTTYTNTYLPNGFLLKAEYNSVNNTSFTNGWVYKYKSL